MSTTNSPIPPMPSATPAYLGNQDTTPLLVMTKSDQGQIRFSLYDDNGTLLRGINAPSAILQVESITKSDISSDGKYLAVVAYSSPCDYKTTGGSCSNSEFLYIFNLATGQPQYVIPLLPSPAELLSEIRRLVVVPYDEQKYSLLADPRAAYEAEMDQLVGSSWDFYIAYLGSHDWSPDGKGIAFSVQTSGVKTAIKVLDVETGSITPVHEKEMVVSSVKWSPDGTWILADDYAIGSSDRSGWFSYSADGKQAIPIDDNGDFLEWVDRQTIVHIRGEFTPHMYLFDINTKQDRLIFDTPITAYAVSPEGRYAAVANIGESGNTDIWYCPFEGGDKIQLDSIPMENQYYLADILAIAPDQVYLALQTLPAGNKNTYDIWMYSPGKSRATVQEGVYAYAFSLEGGLSAFYTSQGKLGIYDRTSMIQDLQMESPTLMLWHPRLPELLVQNTSGINVIHADNGRISTIGISSGTIKAIPIWL
jgi:WD40 repeat protein